MAAMTQIGDAIAPGAPRSLDGDEARRLQAG